MTRSTAGRCRCLYADGRTAFRSISRRWSSSKLVAGLLSPAASVAVARIRACFAAADPVEYAARAKDVVARGYRAMKFDPFGVAWKDMSADDADFAVDLETWRGECAVSREIVTAHDLDDTARPLDWHEDVDLRWLVLRMITEYAQHCGHIDLLREGVDGSIGA